MTPWMKTLMTSSLDNTPPMEQFQLLNRAVDKGPPHRTYFEVQYGGFTLQARYQPDRGILVVDCEVQTPNGPKSYHPLVSAQHMTWSEVLPYLYAWALIDSSTFTGPVTKHIDLIQLQYDIPTHVLTEIRDRTVDACIPLMMQSHVTGNPAQSQPSVEDTSRPQDDNLLLAFTADVYRSRQKPPHEYVKDPQGHWWFKDGTLHETFQPWIPRSPLNLRDYGPADVEKLGLATFAHLPHENGQYPKLTITSQAYPGPIPDEPKRAIGTLYGFQDDAPYYLLVDGEVFTRDATTPEGTFTRSRHQARLPQLVKDLGRHHVTFDHSKRLHSGTVVHVGAPLFNEKIPDVPPRQPTWEDVVYERVHGKMQGPPRKVANITRYLEKLIEESCRELNVELEKTQLQAVFERLQNRR